MAAHFRKEHDLLGELELPSGCMHGIHTERAIHNFPLSGRKVHPALIRAYGAVKLACALTNFELQGSGSEKEQAIEQACREMWDGKLDDLIVVDALQGGAGTSTNMNVNEVLSNRALQLLGEEPGTYSKISPTDDLNLHQSTNDTYPSALKMAAIALARELDKKLISLQEAFQQLEKKFAHIVKIGRTQLQDAVLITLGREMGAYAEAVNRDRWRVYKCEERLRVLNLGGTAIGTGLTAPREYIFRVTDKLRELTGIGFARAENLVDATQNTDVFVEVSGILKACATNLIKISNDLRFMSCGPKAGIAEISIPARQAGSSIMPGKVNPVIPEAVIQCAMLVMANDQAIANACSQGTLELNPFLPLVADKLLESLSITANACEILRKYCVEGIEANEERCREHVRESTAALTALVSLAGYEKASEIAKKCGDEKLCIRDTAISAGLVKSGEEYDELISPQAVCRIGTPKKSL